jgi:hypothetical protein
MVSASSLRLTVERLLGEYEATAGIGVDAYCDQPCYHAMADGKCLQALAVLRSSQLLSAAQFEARAARVHARLAAAALPCFGQGWGWGLGFSWRNLPSSESFLITSAIVTRGARDCYHAGLVAEPEMPVLSRGMRGLEGWVDELSLPVSGTDVRIPAYSQGIQEPIYNAAAYAFATLEAGNKAGILEKTNAAWRHSMDWINTRQIAGLGWGYSPTNYIVDLLHQCYILNSLADVFGVQSVEGYAAEMVGQFAGACCFSDSMRLRTGQEVTDPGRDIPWLRPLGERQLEVAPSPARLWSLGELLVLLSRLGRDGERREGWTRLGRRIAESILTRLSSADDRQAQYPRHVMHALHGLTCYLALLRERARTAPNPRLSHRSSNG